MSQDKKKKEARVSHSEYTRFSDSKHLSRIPPVLALYIPVCVDGSVGNQQAFPVHLSTIRSRCWAWQNSPPSLANAIQVQPEEKQSRQVRSCDAARLLLASESPGLHSL